MRKFNSLFTVTVLTLSAGLLGCVDADDVDPFDTLTTTLGNTGETGDGDGDGDATTGDPTTTGDGDGDATTGDPTTTGDGDGDAACGGFNEACCAGDVCDEGLGCDGGVCGLGGTGDGDGDPTTGGDGDAWDPAACAAPSQVLMVGNLPGTFCSSPCMGDVDCPAGPQGTQAACALTTMQGADPSFCALICQVAQDACPAGSSCKDLMDPMNPGLGLCTYE